MVKIETHNQIKQIVLNDGKVNCLSDDLLQALKEALEECRDAPALVLTGEGKCFSAGLDLKTLPTLDEKQLFKVLEKFSDVLVTILHYPCPVVAAVNGHAIAGGAVISLCCDVTLGAEVDLKVGLSEVAVGMPLPRFVVELARHRLCPTKLTEAVLFGTLYPWKKALEVGYFHETVAVDKLRSTAVAYAEQLAQLPKTAYRPTKAALWEAVPNKLEPDAISAFLTDQAQQHMAKFKG